MHYALCRTAEAERLERRERSSFDPHSPPTFNYYKTSINTEHQQLLLCLL